MVVFKGLPMSMAVYCKDSKSACFNRTMLVNSPKYQRKLRIASRTTGLEFTALAARFETRMEEEVLKSIIHLGF